MVNGARALPPLDLGQAQIRVDYVPSGRFVRFAPHERYSTAEAYFALPVVSGKTPEEALQFARRVDAKSQPSEIHRTQGVLAQFVFDYRGRTSSQGRPE